MIRVDNAHAFERVAMVTIGVSEFLVVVNGDYGV